MATKPSWENEAEGELEDAVEIREPKLYRVLLLNDDYTPMEFVVWILETVFHKSKQESVRLMMDVHTKGQGLCGVYTHDIAQTKVRKVLQLSRQNEHPLHCVMEAN